MGLGSAISSGLNWLTRGRDALGAIGNIAGRSAQGSANQRMAEGNQAINYAQLQALMANQGFQNNLASKNFQQDERTQERKRAMLQALLSGLQDFKITPGNPAVAAAMGTRSGGLTPSAILGSGAGSNREALLSMLGGASQGPIAAPTFTPPTMPTQPTAGLLERGLGVAGLIGSLAGAAGWGRPAPRIAPESIVADEEPITNPNIWGNVQF